MPDPSALQEWIAQAGAGSTRVAEPISIAAVAEAELRGYHPTENPICKFRLALDPADSQHAVVKGIEGHWGEQWQALLNTLKFRLVEAPERDDFLENVSEATQNIELGPSDWHVAEWKIFRFKNSLGEVQVFREELKWVSQDDVVAYSTYDWKPY